MSEKILKHQEYTSVDEMFDDLLGFLHGGWEVVSSMEDAVALLMTLPPENCRILIHSTCREACEEAGLFSRGVDTCGRWLVKTGMRNTRIEIPAVMIERNLRSRHGVPTETDLRSIPGDVIPGNEVELPSSGWLHRGRSAVYNCCLFRSPANGVSIEEIVELARAMSVDERKLAGVAGQGVYAMIVNQIVRGIESRDDLEALQALVVIE